MAGRRRPRHPLHRLRLALGPDRRRPHHQPVAFELDAARRALPEARIIHIYASTELGASITVRDGREGFPAELLDGEWLKLEGGELWVRRSPRAMLGYLGGPAPGEWVRAGAWA